MSYNDSTNRRFDDATDSNFIGRGGDRYDCGHSGGGFRLGRSNVVDSSGSSVSIRNLTPYRMALLGSEGVRRYLETGYIPEDLLD